MRSSSEQIQAIKDLVRAMIFRAELPAGARIVEKDLRQRSGATYRAVRQALTELTQEGLLQRKRHLGTFLARRAPDTAGAVLPAVSTVGVLGSLNERDFEVDPYVIGVMAGIKASLLSPGQIIRYIHPGFAAAALDDLPPIQVETVRHSVQGLIGLEANNAVVLNDLVRAGVAVVALDYGPPRVSFDVLAVDHQEAGYLAATHLLGLGHRRIAFIGEGPNYRSDDPTWQDRMTGYLRAMAEVKGDYPWQWLLNVRRSVEWVEKALPEFHRAHQATAYVLCSGCLLPPTLKVLRGLGLSCPRDVSLACADGLEKSGGDRTVSYARADYELLGRTAVRLLASRLLCRAMPAVRVLLPVDFRPGESSQPPGR